MQDYIKKQIVISLCVYVGQLITGIGVGWSAPFNQKLQDPEETPLPEVITEEQASWVAAFIFAGSSAGPLLTGLLSNTIGRKSCMVIGGIVSLAAVIVLAAAQNVAMIYVGRVLVGFGTGMIYIINIVYQGEIASTNIRGVLLTGTAVFTCLGTLFIFTIAPFMSYGAASYVQVALSGAYLVGLFFVPESPIFHAMNGNEDKAVQVLESLGRTDPNDINKVLSSKEEKTNNTFMSQWRELFYKKSNRRAFFIVLILLILQQSSGANVVTLFATQIFEMAGSTVAPHIATIIVGVTRLAGACVAPITVERVGRKVLLLISTSLCCLSLAILGLYFYLDEQGHNMEVVGWLPLLTLITLYISYDTGFAIIPSALSGEMFSSTARSIGSGLTITAVMMTGFALSTAFTYLIAAIGAGATFWLLASACAVAFLFTMFYVLETKGKTFAEIQQMLS